MSASTAVTAAGSPERAALRTSSGPARPSASGHRVAAGSRSQGVAAHVRVGISDPARDPLGGAGGGRERIEGVRQALGPVLCGG
ncbi:MULTISPECIES: hypothetical protein [Streptomyces]|uniref:Uncharacterized protein n=2 Tax=Streptomyces violaceoruber group TaxID=2867121 RepID=A0ABT4P0I9_9ACTN|nr:MULTISPECIES: hypothetical protein [Streptomyces]MCW8120609.1 hypothetical protein [Streptomyces anthocyanicus]MCZ4634680.1 hypothetical protein [Streptomyces rubrogriseus]MDX3315927.1 hypothetical protein [Streptomyces sp. ME03-5684b]WSB59626.1 hypothetical protein OIE72_05080 [Streptomyces anthocyanicus]WTC47334.1 hypothetical protein OG855_06115 [Streptomyces anthocyanicus]